MATRRKPGDFRHVSVTVTDISAAKRFYGEQLGFPEDPRPDFGFPGAWYNLGGDLQLHIIVNEDLVRPKAERTGFTVKYPHFAMGTDDVDATAAKLRARGVEVREHSTPGTGFRQIFVKDPDGNMVEFIGPLAGTARPAPARRAPAKRKPAGKSSTRAAKGGKTRTRSRT